SCYPASCSQYPDGALAFNAAALEALGASDGDWIAVQSAAGRLVARCKRDDSMKSGQLALPHGYGQEYPAADGERLNNGPRVNVLTDSGNRDPIAGTPYHKHVPVRLERLAAAEAAAYEARAQRIHRAAAEGPVRDGGHFLYLPCRGRGERRVYKSP